MKDDDDLLEIVEAFRAEANDLLVGISEAMLEQEKSAGSEERQQAVDTAFRNAHNIKGAAASLGLGRVEKLVHALEDLLAAIRDGSVAPGPGLTDRVLEALDLIESAVARVRPGEEQLEHHEQALVARLRAVTRTGEEEAPAGQPGPATDQRPGFRRTDEPSKFIRVSHQKLDTLLAQLSELVEMKIRMEEIQRRIDQIDGELEDLERLDRALPRKSLRQLSRGMDQDIQYLGKLLGEIREELMELRMVPADSLFPVLRRTVRDVSRKQKRRVNLEFTGGEHELDRKIVESIQSPLVHLLRNAVYHGIEPEEERRRNNKPPEGRVQVRVSHRGSNIQIEVDDDGAGIDTGKIYSRAIELGWLPEGATRPDPSGLLGLLFSAGMSTSAVADDVSGRGVGLSVVKQVVEALRGIVTVDSQPGKGTSFRISLPLALATDTGLFLQAGGSRYVVPRAAVQRVVRFSGGEVSFTGDTARLWFHDRPVALARLDPSLRLRRFEPEQNGREHTAVILSSAEATAALVVDEVEAEADIVVRDLGTFIRRLENISGLTITASGEMYFVLHPSDLVRAVTGPLSPAREVGPGPGAGPGPAGSREASILVVDDSITSRLLNQKLLTASGFRVLTASDGAQALEMMRVGSIDLVLTDVQMPRLDGYGLTRRIKEDPELNQTPVILLTGLDSREAKERGLETGADAYLIKRELSQADLVGLIDQLI